MDLVIISLTGQVEAYNKTFLFGDSSPSGAFNAKPSTASAIQRKAFNGSQQPQKQKTSTDQAEASKIVFLGSYLSLYKNKCL